MLRRLSLPTATAAIALALAGCAPLRTEPTGPHAGGPTGTPGASARAGTAPAHGTPSATPVRARPTATAVGPPWSTTVGDSGWGGSLADVVATTARDAWAVGSRNEGDPIVMRWNGDRWREVRAPDDAESFNAVAAASPGEVWVFDYTTRAWRWNGSGWTSMGGPGGRHWLGSATAAGPGEVWVAGSTTSEPRRAYAARWSGGRWSETEVPAGVSGISAISAASPDDVWAVGGAAVLHWDGRAWTALTMGDPGFPSLGVPGPPWPGDGTPPLSLGDVDAVSPEEVWAVGTLRIGDREEAVVLRFDGERWTAPDVPAHPDHPDRPVAGTFSAVTGDGRGGFLAAGGRASILHYKRDGGWTDEGTPSESAGSVYVDALARVPGGDRAFAVGGRPDYDEDSSGWIWTRTP
ncbi:hypothetical protein [Microtetraspora niveoalba]|uniref:hypothetical protein n=1 Tax=Microtetraspora niveoalba TaxID=46175 RepID=UPI00082B1C2A|nr:hypothetical protein [Microtetraspora niveoalba]